MRDIKLLGGNTEHDWSEPFVVINGKKFKVEIGEEDGKVYLYGVCDEEIGAKIRTNSPRLYNTKKSLKAEPCGTKPLAYGVAGIKFTDGSCINCLSENEKTNANDVYSSFEFMDASRSDILDISLATDAVSKTLNIQKDLHESGNNSASFFFNGKNEAGDAVSKTLNIQKDLHESGNNSASFFFNGKNEAGDERSFLRTSGDYVLIHMVSETTVSLASALAYETLSLSGYQNNSHIFLQGESSEYPALNFDALDYRLISGAKSVGGEFENNNDCEKFLLAMRYADSAETITLITPDYKIEIKVENGLKSLEFTKRSNPTTLSPNDREFFDYMIKLINNIYVGGLSNVDAGLEGRVVVVRDALVDRVGIAGYTPLSSIGDKTLDSHPLEFESLKTSFEIYEGSPSLFTKFDDDDEKVERVRYDKNSGTMSHVVTGATKKRISFHNENMVDSSFTISSGTLLSLTNFYSAEEYKHRFLEAMNFVSEIVHTRLSNDAVMPESIWSIILKLQHIVYAKDDSTEYRRGDFFTSTREFSRDFYKNIDVQTLTITRPAKVHKNVTSLNVPSSVTTNWYGEEVGFICDLEGFTNQVGTNDGRGFTGVPHIYLYYVYGYLGNIKYVNGIDIQKSHFWNVFHNNQSQLLEGHYRVMAYSLLGGHRLEEYERVGTEERNAERKTTPFYIPAFDAKEMAYLDKLIPYSDIEDVTLWGGDVTIPYTQADKNYTDTAKQALFYMNKHFNSLPVRMRNLDYIKVLGGKELFIYNVKYKRRDPEERIDCLVEANYNTVGDRTYDTYISNSFSTLFVGDSIKPGYKEDYIPVSIGTHFTFDETQVPNAGEFTAYDHWTKTVEVMSIKIVGDGVDFEFIVSNPNFEFLECINTEIYYKLIDTNRMDGYAYYIAGIREQSSEIAPKPIMPQTGGEVIYNFTTEEDGAVTITWQNNSDIVPKYVTINDKKVEIQTGGV